MTAYTLSTPRNTPLNLAAGDTLAVANQGSIFTGTAAIVGAGANTLSLDGFLSGNVIAVQLNTGSNSLTIGSQARLLGGEIAVYIGGGFNGIANTGEIVGGEGIRCADGHNSIANAGTIFGQSAGLNLLGAANAVVNTGLIWSGNTALGSNSPLNVTNSGSLDGGVYGLYAGGASTDASTIVNSGYIYGRNSWGINIGYGDDVVINNGFIQGTGYATFLSAGNDFFDGRNGIQVGTVDGGGGRDVIYGGISFDDLRGGFGDDHIHGGAGADYLDGGADFDLVHYDFATAAVTVNLASPAANTGEAAGDVLLNFEGIVGSNFADMLIGNGDANTIDGRSGGDAIAGGAGVDILFGADGADVLFGEADGDLIIGGAGGDIIRGGLGGDLIVFNVGDNGDLILNFNEGGVRDGFDLRGYFDATGYAGTDPRGAGLMQVLQNGADTDVYLHGAFTFRIEGVVAAAVDDTYFLFQ
jgi:Ca2+-binding RTX toxin-like protein